MITRKKTELAKLFDGFRDTHTHLLSGVDDGPKHTDASRLMLKRLCALGVDGLYFTPHIASGKFNNHDETYIRQRFDGFRHDTEMEIRLAAEYTVDDNFSKHVKNTPLTLGDNHLLIKFPPEYRKMERFEDVFKASMKGRKKIIVAYPERYLFVQRDKRDDIINLFLNSGFKLQLSLLSLIGFHGRQAQRTAQKILEKGYYHFVGTDIHSDEHIDKIERHSVSKKTFALLEELKKNNDDLFR